MNHPFVDGWWRYDFGVALAAAMLFGITANAAPRRVDETVRETDKSGAGVTRLVTGDPAQINAAVAGSPPTAILAITPVQPPAAATPVNSYPAGCTIVGQELRCDRNDNDGFRAWFNAQVSGWDPAGNGPNARIYQFKMDCSGYYQSDCLDLNTTPGDGLDLKPAVVECPGNDPTPCRVAFGESFAKCHPGYAYCLNGTCFIGGNPCVGNADCATSYCDAGYLDLNGTGRPDSFCAAAEACNTGGVAIGTCNYTYFSVSGSPFGTVDVGFVYHGGTLVLDIPTGAKGKYTIRLNRDETFIAAPGTPPQIIQSLRESGFVVNLVTGSCCYGLGTPDAGCVDRCITRSDCEALPEPRVFTPGAKCPPLGPPCLIPYGACCETISGECLDEVFEADCQGTHRVWTSGASCGEAACIADTGACCDHDPFSPCTDDTVLLDCRCATCTWHKLQGCAEIDCAPTPIPTVSEWGLVVLTLLLLTGAKILFARTHVHGSEHRAQAW